jgi:YggT family protein
MPNSYFINPLIFIVDTLFTLYIFAVMLRLFLQWVRADFYNPISQFLLTITQPVLRPLRRFLPPVGNTDTASLFLLVTLAMLKLTIIAGIVRSVPPLLLLFLASLGDLVSLAFTIFKFAIIIQVILSWVAPTTYNPATTLLYDLTTPILRPARNLLPPIGGLDLSPLVALIGLQVVSMLIEPLFPRVF